MLDHPFYGRNSRQLLWCKRRSHSQGGGVKRPLRRRLHHYIKNSSRTGIREPGLYHSENKPVLTVPSERRKVKGNGAEAPFLLRDYAPLKARLSVLEIRQEVRYEVGIHKRYMGIRGYPGGRR